MEYVWLAYASGGIIFLILAGTIYAQDRKTRTKARSLEGFYNKK